MLFSANVTAFESLTKLDKLKAAYLFNFTKFIEWPDSTFRSGKNRVEICIEDNAALLKFLNELVAGRNVGKNQLPVKVTDLISEASCDIAYIKHVDDEKMRSLVESIIISDHDSSASSLSDIIFFEENKRLRFDIKMKKMEMLNINVSSELLKLAREKSS